jgi:hypothetical protein
MLLVKIDICKQQLKWFDNFLYNSTLSNLITILSKILELSDADRPESNFNGSSTRGANIPKERETFNWI